MQVPPLGQGPSIQGSDGVERVPKKESLFAKFRNKISSLISKNNRIFDRKTIRQMSPMQVDAGKNFETMRKEFKKSTSDRRQLKLIDTTFKQLSPYLRGSIPAQNKFKGVLKSVLANPETSKQFSEFLDLAMGTGENKVGMVADKIVELDPELRDVRRFEISLIDVAVKPNTQIFDDFIMNGVYLPEDPKFKESGSKRIPKIAELEQREMTKHEEILNADGFYEKNMFQYGKHDIRPSNTGAEYRITIAVPGKSVHEVHIQVDFAPYLQKDYTAEDLNERFEVFREYSVMDKSDHKRIEEFKEGVEDKEFLGYLVQLCGDEQTKGEIPSKLDACFAGRIDIDDVEVFDRTNDFFGPVAEKKFDIQQSVEKILGQISDGERELIGDLMERPELNVSFTNLIDEISSMIEEPARKTNIGTLKVKFMTALDGEIRKFENQKASENLMKNVVALVNKLESVAIRGPQVE